MSEYTATYSPEDNKLRLYSLYRLDSETYERAKTLGFRWAPKQELFVAPMWTPEREDFLLELVGEIEPEEMSLADRAVAKVERIENAIDKARRESDSFSRAAEKIAERFYMGQPILVGHHSERKARKDRDKMDRAQSNACACIEKAKWLAYKANGVESHANRKNRSDVRARRIKTLLAELRDLQRKLNHGHHCLDMWTKIAAIEDVEKRESAARYYSGMRDNVGGYSRWEAWSDLQDGKKTADEVIAESIQLAERTINSEKLFRWIEHTLNRLSYERSELGDTKRYEGDFRETLIQMFVRENGAESPKATKTETGYKVSTSVPLPYHIGEGKELELTIEQWRDLMQSCGYEPAVKEDKPAAPPLLNLDVHSVTIAGRYGNGPEISQVHPITKEEYAKIPNDYKMTKLSNCGSFKVRYGRNPGVGYVAFFLTNSKAHPIPESDSIVKKEGAA